MDDYTSNDGLKVLEYLGIKNLDDDKIEVFKKEWEKNYSNNGDFIGTVWHLYSEVLPFTCGGSGTFILQTFRDINFAYRLKDILSKN